MEGNKREHLARLYALRAGLSALSLEYRGVRAECERAKQVRTKIEDNTAALENYHSIVSTSKKTYKSAKHDYNKAKREYDKKSFSLWCWTIAFLCFAAVAVYVFYLRKNAGENIILYNIGAGVLGICAAYSALRSALINLKVRPIRKKMRDARELMSDSKAWIEQSEDGAFAVKEETKGLKESRRDLDASSDSALAILLPFANAFRSALVETFSSVLSESCYGALDFLIYEIKTGAAEDIPAATLAAEAKKNLNVLDEAVTASHEKIKMDFDSDSDELSDEIGAELSVLEGKLSARLGDVLLKIERSRLSDFGGASAVREELEKSCRTAYMLKAFAACTECTSYDLASAVEYLCADEK